MVNISSETPEKTRRRLERVIRDCRLSIYDAPHVFEEFPRTDWADRADPRALALVRDDAIWSQLLPYEGPLPAQPGVELFHLWRFHFPAGADNSGFVGWLASHLKDRLGTGVFVVCGQNASDGGIFDYWGGPWNLREALIREVSELAS